MALYKKILVPYDFSAPSNKALNFAINLATLCRTKHAPEVNLLYVVEEINVPPSFEYGMKMSHTSLEEFKTTEEYLKEKYHNMKSNALKILGEKKKNFENRGISISTHVLLGHPVDKITEFAISEEVDLIVMGNKGLRGLQRIKTLGSVSRGVSENAKCHVMIVR